VSVTSDGGQTWTSKRIGSLVQFVVPIAPGRAYALVGQGRKVVLSLSTDYGLSWTPLSDSVDFLDSYSFGVDPCSEDKIYVVNEDAGGTPNNGLAEMFVSANGGVDWRVTYERPVRDLVGSISVASNAVYVQTVARGIVRSTDFGSTWQDVGGPSAPFDTRLVCAVDDNRVLAADHEGSIWVTENGGGDSVFGPTRIKELALSRFVLFENDTLYSCDDPALDSTVLRGIFCSAPQIARITIEGQHRGDFKLLRSLGTQLTGSDTLIMRFYPGGNGPREATLVIVLRDSTRLSLPLRGFGRGLAELSIMSAGVANDTIGGEVYVPVIFPGFAQISGVEFNLHWASPQLEYIGTYNRLGARSDVTEMPRRVRITEPSPDDTIAHALFRVYPHTDACVPVRFDSIVVLSSKSPCAFAINPTVTTEICMPNDCETRIVSQFMRYDRRPTLSLIHERRQLTLRTALNLGKTTVRVYSPLGQLMEEHQVMLTPTEPFLLSSAWYPSGVYYVHVQSALDTQSFKLLVQR
jgi:photosystem II stability/assembly factor-like uncharacterized protein